MWHTPADFCVTSSYPQNTFSRKKNQNISFFSQPKHHLQETMSFRDLVREIKDTLQANYELSHPIGEISSNHRNNTRKRGVRPNLNTRCPVTSRLLLEESGSVVSALSSPVISLQSTSLGDDEMLPPLRPLTTKSQQTCSMFSQLSSEVACYQKLVVDLEAALKKSTQSPESQWKTKIMIRSAKESGDMLSLTLSTICNDGIVGMAGYRKLQRDFQRAQTTYNTMIKRHERRQKADISYLLSAKETKEEDFFERAMREREEEINTIHSSMQKVDDIYQVRFEG